MRVGAFPPGVLASVAIVCASCDGVPVDSGADAELRLEGAQFRREAFPEESGGPAVVAATVAPRVTVGTRGTIGGALNPSATGVVVGLDGDRGYWVVAAGIPDVTAPRAPTFRAPASFATRARTGPRTVRVRAVDEGGRFGPALERPVVVRAASAAEGAFVVALRWSNDADLDLLVTEPGGVEIFKGNRSSAPALRPGETKDAAASMGGILDLDSNASCVADGRRAENVVYAGRPPAGHYVVRVDAFSLCGRTNAHWHVEASLDGAVVGAAEGVATEIDTRFPHGRGGGVIALELDVP